MYSLSLPGHQKKIMLAIDRLKRLHDSGHRLSGLEPPKNLTEGLEPASSYPTPHWLTDRGGGTLATPPTIPSHGPPPRDNSYISAPKRSTSGENISDPRQSHHGSTQDDSIVGEAGQYYQEEHQQGRLYFAKQDHRPDLVCIQVNRSTTGRSMDSLDTDHTSPPHPALQYQSFHGGTLNR